MQRCSYTYKTAAIIILTKTTAVKNEVALNYRRVRVLCFPAVVFAATIDLTLISGVVGLLVPRKTLLPTSSLRYSSFVLRSVLFEALLV